MDTRERSPNYPAFDLEETIGLVEKLYAGAGRTSVSNEAVAIALGYTTLNGRSKSKIASLRHYGLIETTPDGKLRVSDRAVDLIHKADETQFMSALRASALAPSLFQELWAKFPNANDAILKNHLIRDRKFSKDGADRVVESFKKTVDFSKLREASPPDSHKMEKGEVDTGDKLGAGGKGLFPPPDHIKQRNPEGGFVAFNFLLSGGVNANVAFSPKPTSRAIDRLIEYLTLMRDDLSEDAQKADSNEGAAE